MPDIFFNGYQGVKLQCRYYDSCSDVLVLILHPHPLHGGTMDNKVVFNSYKTARSLGYSVLRYNSRSAGKSEGKFDNGDAESKDLTALVDDFLSCNSFKKFYVIGFSFGCYVLLRSFKSIQERIDKFVMIAPPSNLFDFSDFSKVSVKGLVLQGTEDDIVPCHHTDDLMKMASKNITYHKIEGAGHFFEGYESQFSESISNFLAK